MGRLAGIGGGCEGVRSRVMDWNAVRLSVCMCVDLIAQQSERSRLPCSLAMLCYCPALYSRLDQTSGVCRTGGILLHALYSTRFSESGAGFNAPRSAIHCGLGCSSARRIRMAGVRRIGRMLREDAESLSLSGVSPLVLSLVSPLHVLYCLVCMNGVY